MSPCAERYLQGDDVALHRAVDVALPVLSRPTPAGHCLTTVVRTEGPTWSSQGLVFRPDPARPILAQNLPALCRPVPTGHSLTTVVRAEGPAWSSPGSVFRPDPVRPVGAQKYIDILKHPKVDRRG